MATRPFVALGANLGDRRENLSAAIRLLGAAPGVEVLRRGPVLETDALLPADDAAPQPRYLNTVVQLSTTLSPPALLRVLRAVERRLGRRASRRWAPRPIDLDIVLWGELVHDTASLTVPHPRMHLRRFVLEPLAALEPDAVHPVLQKSVRALLEAVIRRAE